MVSLGNLYFGSEIKDYSRRMYNSNLESLDLTLSSKKFENFLLLILLLLFEIRNRGASQKLRII
jgi:hypothetical protein